MAQARDAVPAPPAGGWVRTIREALGMSQRDLAQRMGVSHAAVAKMESSEKARTAQLSTLQRAAEAMDCDVVYAIVPRTSLDDIRARRVAALTDRLLERVGHTMDLEAQSETLTDDERRVVARQVSESGLWREP